MEKITSTEIHNSKYFTLLTGATGGLGIAFCHELCKQGHNIFMTSTSNKKLNALYLDLIAKYPNAHILYHECDMSQHDSRIALLDHLKENKININLLINNAGFITEGSIDHTTSETLLKCIQVNCEGTIHITKELLDIRDKDTKFSIINITSMAGNYPMPYMAIYASTKALLNNFMTSLRYEYRNENVNVLNVEPGGIETSPDMIEAIKSQGLKGKLSAVPAEKIAADSIKLSQKNKKRYIPGIFNKTTLIISNLATTDTKVKTIGKSWKQSQEKRNIK